MNTNTLSIAHLTKINSKWITYRMQNYNSLKQNIKEDLDDLGLVMSFQIQQDKLQNDNKLKIIH